MAHLKLLVATVAAALLATGHAQVQLPLNGTAVNGVVKLNGPSWQGYFMTDHPGRIQMATHIPNPKQDFVVAFYVGLNYYPSGERYDYTGSSVEDQDFQLIIDNVFPNYYYFVTVISEELGNDPVPFELTTALQVAPPPQVVNLRAGTPFYGTTPVRQYTWFTFTPSNDDPLTVKLSVLNGGADIFVKAGSPATRGNQDWNASVKKPGNTSFPITYVQPQQQYYISVLGDSDGLSKFILEIDTN